MCVFVVYNIQCKSHVYVYNCIVSKCLQKNIDLFIYLFAHLMQVQPLYTLIMLPKLLICQLQGIYFHLPVQTIAIK